MPSKRPKTRFQDILDNIGYIENHTDGVDFEAFLRNRIIRDAVERCLSRLSEAATKLGSSAEDLVPNQDWIAIRNLGNKLRHEYDGLDDQAIWAMATYRLPSLKSDIQKIIHSIPDDDI